MGVILYTTHCPKCMILEKKLQAKNIEYNIEVDVEKMLKMGMTTAPHLQVDENIMDFNEAVQWINKQ